MQNQYFSDVNTGSQTSTDDEPVYRLGNTPVFSHMGSQNVGAVQQNDRSQEDNYNSGNVSQPQVDLGPLATLAGWGGAMQAASARSVDSLQPPTASEQDIIETADESAKYSSPAAVMGTEQGQSSQNDDSSLQEIETDKIFPNPFQPRKTFDPVALQELADSIREYGVIQPIVVTRTPAGFELVAGERRFRASVLAGLTKVPAIIKAAMADQAKLEVALIENIQRHELNPIEEAQAYQRLIQGFGLTQELLAKKLGKSRPAITNTLRLLNLPSEVQRAIIDGKLAEGHARPLLQVRESSRQLALFHEILAKGLNTRQIEARARELSQPRTMDGLAADPRIMAMETALRGKVGAPVRIKKVGRGGQLIIDFFSDEELEEIVGRVGSGNQAAGDARGEYITV